MAHPSNIKEVEARASWKIGSTVQIYSSSLNKWFKAEILRILSDAEGEWLECQYNADNSDTRVKQAKRDDETTIRPFIPTAHVPESIIIQSTEKETKSQETPQSPRSSNWKCIESFTEDHYAKPIIIDGSKMLIAPGDMNQIVYKYDFIKQKSKILFKYPQNLEPFQVSTCIDYNKQKIYLYCTYTSSKENALMEYDIATKELITYQEGLHDVGAFPVLCCLHGNIHLIGGRLNSAHLIWDGVDKRFSERPFRSKMIHGHAVIPLASTKQLLVLGGNDSHLWGGYLGGIWICDTVPSIRWKYLEKVAMPHKMYHFGYIKTKNERQVIIFGGKSKTGLRDEIWILNLISFEWIKSDIKCPKKGKFYAVKTRDGYVHLFEIDTKHYWKMQLSIIVGTSRHKRSESLPIGLGGLDKFAVDNNNNEEEKETETKKVAPKNTWEQKVIALLHENQLLKKTVKASEERIDALIKQNVKLNKDMRAMEKQHLEDIRELQKELQQYQNSSQ